MAGRLTSLFGTLDMTQGSPYAKLIRFAVPLLIGNFAQQMYNTVDSIVVGKYVGDGALAAVGASGPLLNLLLVLFIGISTGANIMVAQYFGARNKEALSKTVGTAMTLTLLCSLLIMLVGPVIVKPFLRLVGIPADIFDMTASYLIIIFVGIIGMAFYNILAGVLRGMGDSVMPLVFLLVACAINIVLDLLFVVVFHWGVPGVAWATVIAQLVSSILCGMRVSRMHDVVELHRDTFRPQKAYVMELVRLGIPSGASQAIFSTAAILVQNLANTFGTLFIACNTVVMRVDGFAVMPCFTFGNAMTSYVGQNIGAGKMDRVHKGTRAGLQLAMGVSIVLVLCILLFGKNLMQLFTDTTELVNMGASMLRILALGYIAMSVTQTLSGAMRGAGDTVTPMWISVVTTIIIRMPLAYLLAYLTRTPENPTGACESIYYSMLIAWVSGAVINSVVFRRGVWKKRVWMPEGIQQPEDL